MTCCIKATFNCPLKVVLMQAVELGRRIGQGQGSRRVSHAGAEGKPPRRQSSMLEGPTPRRQSSGSGSRLGLRRSTSVISSRMAPMQLEQLLTGKHLPAGLVNLTHTLTSQLTCAIFQTWRDCACACMWIMHKHHQADNHVSPCKLQPNSLLPFCPNTACLKAAQLLTHHI